MLLALAAIFLAACGDKEAAVLNNVPNGTATTMTGGATPDGATSVPVTPDLDALAGFIFPIAGACLPQSDNLMPNAPRAYRSGVHEGVDFYEVDNCTQIERGTPVIAARDGTVVRADHAYADLTQAELAEANARIANGQANSFEVLDLFRGRQVWIHHGDGIVTRYAHLSGIPAGLRVGSAVARGGVVGYVGDSGTPESLSNPGSEIHLHWELRTDDTFLGAGLPAPEVRALYERLFSP